MPGAGKKDAILSLNWSNATERQGTAVIDGGQPGASAAGNGAGALTPKGGRLNNGRLSNTGLETSSSILAGALTLMSAFMVGRRKQKYKIISRFKSAYYYLFRKAGKLPAFHIKNK